MREVTAMGFPLKSWFSHKTMGCPRLHRSVSGHDNGRPKYFEEFWTTPGYLGANPTASLKSARLQFPSTIKLTLSATDAEARGIEGSRMAGTARGAADSAWQAVINDGSVRPVAFELEDTPPDVGFMGGDLVILSGAAAGKRLAVSALSGASSRLA